MCSRNRTTASTEAYWDKIQRVRRLLERAGRVLVGVGAGMSAAAGLNYADPALASKWFPEYCARGPRTLLEIQSRFWRLDACRPEAYWGYWARHIWHIRYEPGALAPYRDLFELMRGREFFICSTNVDGQLEKAGFPRERIFAPQGDYQYFQCSRPCGSRLYPNRELVETMIANMHNAFDIRKEDVPLCPRCGAPLVPNLRCDATFVEEPHLWNREDYRRFADGCRDQDTLLLELGVGYNTPVIIRYPFEEMALRCPRSALVRVNTACADTPAELCGRGVPLREDIKQVLSDLRG